MVIHSSLVNITVYISCLIALKLASLMISIKHVVSCSNPIQFRCMTVQVTP